ncbi:MAG: hypothetical protein H6908_00750 [Hyphomicrobiales bacterium]|nr:hypothetical protein [Hyphomicrobiales bacterium]
MGQYNTPVNTSSTSGDYGVSPRLEDVLTVHLRPDDARVIFRSILEGIGKNDLIEELIHHVFRGGEDHSFGAGLNYLRARQGIRCSISQGDLMVVSMLGALRQ